MDAVDTRSADMLTVACVLRSGGIYDQSWVRKLRDGVKRHLTVPHRFVCLSDIDVPCERIPLRHGWPGWWSKLEMFAPGVLTTPTLYFDLDTAIVGNIDALADLPYDFAMLRGLTRTDYIGSGVMWFRNPPRRVYERFAESPEKHIAYHERIAHKAHIGDQAFVYETLGDKNIVRLSDDVPGLIRLYPKHFEGGRVPDGCGVCVFKGKVKPPDAMHLAWAREAWA
jgi:hypothetical protein